MRKLPSRKLLATLVAGVLFVPHTGFTLGLGEIEVSSALNQKLNADIELLSATPEDTENIIVKLAPRKEFSRAGIDRPYSLNDLRFKSELVDGVPHIKVTSSSPIREPYLNFLIEIDWPNGHLLREYTILLDPPVFMTRAASSVDSSESRPSAGSESRPAVRPAARVSSINAPVPTASASAAGGSRPATQVTAPTPASARSAPASAPAFIPAPVVQAQTPINQPPNSYRIKSGDTAWSLADAMRPNKQVTVPQMMFAILRANPGAFNRDNINGLKRGYVLRMPDEAQISAISRAEAQAMMNEHAALWRQYMQAQSGEQPVSALASDSSGSATGGGGEAAADNAHLAIVSAGSGSSVAGSKDPSQMSAQELRAELALARERIETERVEKEALQSRINTLEQYAGQREGLLTVEDEGLSGVQALNANPETGRAMPGDAAAELAEQQQSAETLSEGEPVDATDLSAEQPAGAELAGDELVADQAAAEQVAAEQAAAELAPGEGAVVDDTDADAVFTDEVGEQAAGDEASAMPADVAAPSAVAPSTVDTDAQTEPVATDPLSRLLNNPMLLAAAGGGLLLVLALIGLVIKRRKDSSEDEGAASTAVADLESIADDIAEETADESAVAESLAGDEKVADTAEALTEEAESAVEAEVVSEESTDELRDDVIAEAEVYLAYGIYQQAEDLLNQAITENPERNDYRVKLAETHFASKNAEAFSEIATELNDRLAEDSVEWQKVLTMGQELCADNPLFQGAAAAGAEVPAPDEPAMDFDLGDSSDGSEAAGSSADLGEELELPEMDEVATEDKDDVLSAPVEEIEFDLSDTGAVEATDSEDEFSLDIDADELDIRDELDIQDEVVAEAEEEIEEETMDLTDFDIGLPEEAQDESTVVGGSDEAAAVVPEEVLEEASEIEGADLVLEQDQLPEEVTAEADAEEEIMLDLSEEAELMDIGSDEASADELVAEESDAETKAAVNAANDDIVDEGEFDLSSLDDIDEVSTKLDLARAYMDMGDQDGTRDILEEVLADGNDEQKQEANELLSKLAS